MGMLSWATEAGETGGPAAPGCCFVALSSNGALSGLSAESLSDLGMTIPSTLGGNGHGAPPKPRSNCQEGAVPTENQHLPSASARTQSGPAAAAALQQP